MNTQELKKWIIENLTSPSPIQSQLPQTDGFAGLWGRKKAKDGNYYEIHILYIYNQKTQSSFVAMEDDLKDSINFYNPNYNQFKLDKLVNDIEKNLVNSKNDYKLELVSNTSFKLTIF